MTDANVAFLMLGILIGIIGVIAVIDWFTYQDDDGE